VSSQFVLDAADLLRGNFEAADIRGAWQFTLVPFPEYKGADINQERGSEMSKGMDSKKSEKKKPAKTMKEKKAAKQEKKNNAK
jgi:hypothetical protein